MRCRAAVIAAWAGLAAAPAAAAVRHPDHPDTPIEQVVKGPATDAAGNPRRAWVTARGAEPVELPPDPRKPNQPVVKVPRLRPVEFAETFFVGADTQDHYLLLKLGAGNAVTEYAGWVQRDRVLTRSEAVFDQDSLIYRKAMIINTRDMIGAAAAKDGGLPIRHAPDAATPSVDEPLRLFGVYFVYGEAADAGGQAHVLLGGLPAFDPDPDPKAERHVRKVVFGWVPRDRVCPWNTREAVEWDWRPTLKDDALRAVLDPAKRVNMRPFSAAPPPPRRAAPGRIYSTPDDARRALRGEEPARPVLMEEQLDAAGEAREPGFADMRFPVLDWDAKAHGPQDGFTHPAAGRLYRVGVLGGFRSLGGGKGPDPRQIQKLLAELARLEKELTVTEVLFVVDDTQSIAPWFIDIANTFKQLKAAAAAGKAKNVRIGLVFYNDVTPTNAEPVKPWRPKGKAGDDRVLWPLDQYGDEMIRELDVTDETRNLPRDRQASNHKYTDGVDRREMVFRGIREAVALAKFSPVARKLVVVIGDDGDRDPGDPKFKEYQATYNPAKLVEDLVPPADAGHSAVEFYAVQVVNPADRDQLAFRDQMTEVVNLYKAEAQAAGYPPRAQLVTATQADALAARVRKAFEETEGDVETSRVALERLRRGQWKSTVFTPEMEKIIRKRLEALNDPDLTFDRLRQLDGFQLFEIGYVWEKPGAVSQLRPRLLMSKPELETVVRCLTKLENPNPAQRPDPKELVTELVKAVTGEPAFAPAGETKAQRERRLKAVEADLGRDDVAVVLHKHTGLKFESPLFKQLVGKVQHDAVGVQDRYDLLFVRDRLDDIAKNRFRVYDRAELSDGGIPVARWRPDDATARQDADTRRAFNLPGDITTEWYWVDQRREWP